MDLELIVDAAFDPMEDYPIGALDLAVGLGVIDQTLIHPDLPGVAEVQELVTYELSAIVSNNVIGYFEPMDDVLDEFDHPL